MSKKGRQRRTPEQRDAAKEARSDLAYLHRLVLVSDREKFKQIVQQSTESK